MVTVAKTTTTTAAADAPPPRARPGALAARVTNRVLLLQLDREGPRLGTGGRPTCALTFGGGDRLFVAGEAVRRT